jgi:hypothetical protein
VHVHLCKHITVCVFTGESAYEAVGLTAAKRRSISITELQHRATNAVGLQSYVYLQTVHIN